MEHDADEVKSKQSAEHHAKAVASKPKEGPNIIERIRSNALLLDALFMFVLLLGAGAYLYLADANSKVYIEKSQINAPIIYLSAASPGIIDKFYVAEGDKVAQGQKIAKVGEEIVYARTSGIIISIKNTPGQFTGPTDYVASMFDPGELRVIGRVQEDKGLKDIMPGQKVVFTVDAFPGKEYPGTIDSVAASARQSDIMFSISEKRQENEFEVKATFDSYLYSEIKNGMSAKMWVYKS